MLYILCKPTRLESFDNMDRMTTFALDKNTIVKDGNKEFSINFIVLKRDKERNTYIRKLIKNNNINYYNIIDATDGKNIDLKYYIDNNYITYLASRDMRLGAIGCAISHIKLWETFLKNNDNLLIVMEDDVYLMPDFNENLYHYINHLPKNFDISYLLIHPNKLYQNKFNNSIHINKYVKKGFGQWGTVAYILSKKGANRLIKLCKPIVNPIDIMIKETIENNKIISYMPTNKLVYMPYSFKSNIWTTKQIYNQ